ncbi:hypothetical protein [Marivirga sp.]|uniref:hypothetical protein n=1 Tax=Marivirga sp. TaxID=2018662 RepID=UPI0025D4F54E|nr:hypothetical protein [Marivirga sp.]
MNKHIANNLYKSNIQKYSTITYILNLLCFGCLTSVFLFGAYSLFNPDSAYLVGILSLVLISIFNSKLIQKPYWYLRPKINQVLFSNLFNISNLIFSLLCIILIYFNFQSTSKEIEFGIVGSLIFILGLPFAYYIWLIFTHANEKGIIEIFEINSFKTFKNYEFYFIIIFIALFGVAYDYFSQTVEVLLFIPVGVLIILSIILFITNRIIHNSIPRYFQSIEHQQINENINENLVGVYEKDPYRLISVLNDDFPKKTFSEQKYLLFTLKRIVAIDAIESLESIIEKLNNSNPIYNIILEVHQYLVKIDHQVEEIQNTYEFIEQSNDIIIIKGLIRKQISNNDKNIIIKLLNDNRVTINKPACVVAGYYNDINIISLLIEHLEKPELSYWAQLALHRIGNKSIKYLEIEFSKRKENLLFVESCFNLIGKIGDEDGYKLLFRALNEPDSNIRKIVAKKIILYKIKVTQDQRKNFRKLFDDLIITLLSNGYLIEQLEIKNENFKLLKNAIDNENKESLFLIINIVKLYYNSDVTEKIFKNYRTNSKSLHAASNTLIDVIIDDNISVRNKLKVLFSPKEKLLLESMQEEFPSVNLKPKFNNEEDLIWFILKMEYDQINSWTRSCALNILQYTYKEDIPFELASEFLNKNLLLKETAAANIYKNLPEFYTIFLSRLKENDASKIDYLICSNLDVVNNKQINEDNLLVYDKISFLISIPYLNNLSISEIINFQDYFKTKVLKAGEHQISLEEEFNLGFWLLETGSLSFSKNGIDFYNYDKRDIIKVSDHDNTTEHVYFYCKQDVRFLIVEEIILMNIIKDYYEIMQKYIDILPDKSSKKIVKELNQNAA